MSTLPDIATMIPMKLYVCGSSGSELAMGDVQGKVRARLRRWQQSLHFVRPRFGVARPRAGHLA